MGFCDDFHFFGYHEGRIETQTKVSDDGIGSCSGYSKVLKSNDSNLKYQTAIEYTDKGKYNKALTLFQDVAHVYAQSARADTLAYYTGLCYYKSGDFVFERRAVRRLPPPFRAQPVSGGRGVYVCQGFLLFLA